jgi:hypothetical protein
MDDLRGALCRLLVPALEPVPLDRQRADVLVLDPLHAMQIGAAFAVDDLGREALHRGMIAVEQHQRGPVLARIDRLRSAVHLGGLGRTIVVLHAIDRLRHARVFDEARNIAEPQEIAVAEQRPAAIAGERRREKARIGELGRCQRILVAMIEAACAQFVELDRRHRERDRRAAHE